jgi:hypothetical protein
MQAEGLSMPTPPITPTTPAGDNPWLEGNQFLVCLSDGESACKWQFALGAGDDLRLVLDEQAPDGGRSGEVMLVAGAVLLSRGLAVAGGADGSALDVVDGPGLMLKLVLELLGRAIPGGPAAVSTPVQIDLDELGEALTLSTLSASASFLAPWWVRGEVRRTDEAVLAFDLVFTHDIGTDEEASPRLRGTWAKATPAPALDDRMSLDGWRMFSLGPRVDGSLLDYGADRASWQAATLGQLRRALATREPST